MAKAWILIQNIVPGGSANMATVNFQFTTDTGLIDQSSATIDSSKSNAENAAAIRSAAVDAITTWGGGQGPSLTTADVILLDYPN